MPLSAPSCEQGASPSLSHGCRNITPLSLAQVSCLSVDIVTIDMLRNANSAVGFVSLSYSVFVLSKNLVCSFHIRRNLCVLFPVGVSYRVVTHPGHAYLRRVPAAAGFSTHNMAGQSNMTTSTLGVMSSCFSDASSKHQTMPDLVPSFSFPLADSDCGHG